MSNLIPLIRAGCLVPHIRWMEGRGRPIADLLGSSGVPGDPVSEPERPIPLLAAFAFLRDAARREGKPDLGWRVVSETSVADLGLLGRLALAERTPGQALARASQAMPNFCSHERLTLVELPGGASVLVDFSVRPDLEALHQGQLLTVALIGVLCAAARRAGSPLERVEMVPHPRAGLRHIPDGVAPAVVAAPTETLTLRIGDAVLRRRLPRGAEVEIPAMRAWYPLRTDGDFLPVVRRLVEALVDDGDPSAERVAQAAGVGLRTLQRRLAAKGASFSALVDATRRRRALERLAAGSTPVAEIAAGLGYAAPSALTRAVRRWTGRPPQHLLRDRPQSAGD